MIQYGRSIRWFNDYQNEVEFSKRNHFDFIQAWFTKHGIGLNSVPEPKTDLMMKVGYPVLIHALLDINEFEESIPNLVDVLKTLHYRVCEIEEMFQRNPGVKFLLDIAHIDSYEHLREIVKVKKPEMLHVADKHFHTVHEHLPIGEGDLDFAYILNDVLSDFEEKIIFEVTDGDETIIKSKEIIQKVLAERVRNIKFTGKGLGETDGF